MVFCLYSPFGTYRTTTQPKALHPEATHQPHEPRQGKVHPNLRPATRPQHQQHRSAPHTNRTLASPGCAQLTKPH